MLLVSGLEPFAAARTCPANQITELTRSAASGGRSLYGNESTEVETLHCYRCRYALSVRSHHPLTDGLEPQSATCQRGVLDFVLGLYAQCTAGFYNGIPARLGKFTVDPRLRLLHRRTWRNIRRRGG